MGSNDSTLTTTERAAMTANREAARPLATPVYVRAPGRPVRVTDAAEGARLLGSGAVRSADLHLRTPDDA